MRLSVSETHCYPNFKPDRVTIDLAAIKLKTPLPISKLDSYPPLCFNTKRKRKELFFTTGKVEMFGWGKIDKPIKKRSTVKSSGNVIVGVALECKNIFEKEGLQFDVGIICTIANTTSACTGDYGSGLITTDNDNEILLGGIVSRSTKVCGHQNSYIAHTRLNTKVVTKWVRGIIQPTSYLGN